MRRSPRPNGFPLRLIAPGWYGIANVKWLKRIEVACDAFPENRFMGRDYVTIREEQRNGEEFWAETSVGRVAHQFRTRPGHTDRARATGSPVRPGAPRGIARSRGANRRRYPWVRAMLDRGARGEFAWRFWFLDWGSPPPGEHTIASRAIDAAGNIQPATPDNPEIVNKHTFWESNQQVTRHILMAS